MHFIYIAIITLLFLIVNDCICNISHVIEGVANDKGANDGDIQSSSNLNPQNCNGSNDEDINCLHSGNCAGPESRGPPSCPNSDCAAKRLCLQREIICNKDWPEHAEDSNTNQSASNGRSEGDACSMISDYKQNISKWRNGDCRPDPTFDTRDCLEGKIQGIGDETAQTNRKKIHQNFCSDVVSRHLGCNSYSDRREFESRGSGREMKLKSPLNNSHMLLSTLWGDNYNILTNQPNREYIPGCDNNPGCSTD